MSDTEHIPQPNLPRVAVANGGWSPTRLAVRGLLEGNAPALVGLYEAAVQMLHDERFPARRHLIAHCVREIANSLPFFFDGAIVGHVEYRPLIQRIVEPWAEAGLPIGTEAAPVTVGEAEAIGAGSSIMVPGPIVRQIGKMLEAHTAVSGRRRQNAAVLFQALSPDTEGDAYHLMPTIDLWLETCDWFQRRVHHNRRPEEPADNVLHGEFIANFERFGGLLHQMTEPFLNIVNILDEELDKANS
jgi:hypothetical protein